MSTDDNRSDDDNVVHVSFGGPANTLPPPDETEPEQADDSVTGIVNDENHQKFRLFSEWIDSGMVMVTIDTTAAGVCVPRALDGDPALHLNFSHRFYLDDFAYDDRGVRATLSFGGQPGFCDLPWSAIWMLRAHETEDVCVFPASVPPDFVGEIRLQDDDNEHDGDEIETRPEPIENRPKPIEEDSPTAEVVSLFADNKD